MELRDDGQSRVWPHQRMEAGCYNDNEEMVAPWPCFVMTDDDGNMDVYTVANVRAWSE